MRRSKTRAIFKIKDSKITRSTDKIIAAAVIRVTIIYLLLIGL
jgi:hypothetical protein